MTRITIPAPLGGVNLRDGIANIQSPEAIVLNNLIPRPTCVENRGATSSRGDAQVGEIRTLAGHPSGILAVGGFNGVQNYLRPFNTDTNAFGVAVAISANNAPFWNSTLFKDLLILTNGADTPQAMNAGGGFASLVITGVTAEDLWGCQTFKGRVFYWEENAQSFWYAAAGAYQGALTEFDLSAYTVKDGYLFALVPLTIDGGAGPDDLAAFVFSTGEVLLFQGDDPGDANAWQQIGRFNIPNPIGPQSWVITGSASIVGTVLGAVDLARALAVGAYDVSAVVGQQVTGTAINALPSPIVNSQLLIVPNDNLLLWSRYPADDYQGGADLQTLNMDLTAKKWSLFNNEATIDGIGATCIGVCNNRLFLGDRYGQLHEYILTSTGDTIAVIGTQSNTKFAAVQAYTDFGAPTNRKKVTAVSPITECDSYATGTTGVTFGFNEDYVPNTSNLITTVNIPAASGAHSENFSRCAANGFRLGLTWEQTAPYGGTGRYRWIATDVILKTGGEM